MLNVTHSESSSTHRERIINTVTVELEFNTRCAFVAECLVRSATFQTVLDDDGGGHANANRVKRYEYWKQLVHCGTETKTAGLFNRTSYVKKNNCSS